MIELVQLKVGEIDTRFPTWRIKQYLSGLAQKATIYECVRPKRSDNLIDRNVLIMVKKEDVNKFTCLSENFIPNLNETDHYRVTVEETGKTSNVLPPINTPKPKDPCAE